VNLRFRTTGICEIVDGMLNRFLHSHMDWLSLRLSKLSRGRSSNARNEFEEGYESGWSIDFVVSVFFIVHLTHIDNRLDTVKLAQSDPCTPMVLYWLRLMPKESLHVLKTRQFSPMWKLVKKYAVFLAYVNQCVIYVLFHGLIPTTRTQLPSRLWP
jgi:hypothetical protein